MARYASLKYQRSYSNDVKQNLEVTTSIVPHDYRYLSPGSWCSAQKMASLEEDL